MANKYNEVVRDLANEFYLVTFSVLKEKCRDLVGTVFTDCSDGQRREIVRDLISDVVRAADKVIW